MKRRERVRGTFAWGLAVFAGMLTGCDRSGSSSGPPLVATPSQSIAIAVILPFSGNAEMDVWEQAARVEESRMRTIVDVYRMSPGDPASRQVDLIKEAIAKGCSALVVVPADPAAIAPVLTEARDSGIPVVLVDRDVPTSGKPFPLVIYESEHDSAKQLVQAALEDSKRLGIPPAVGTALILVNGPADDHARARQKALREALEEAGVYVGPDVIFRGMSEEGEAALKAAVLTTPFVTMVFADEDRGLSGAVRVRHNSDRARKRFVLAGYTTDKAIFEMVRLNVTAGVVDRSTTLPMAKAFGAALAMLKGDTVADRIVIPTPMSRATGEEDEEKMTGFVGTPVPNAVTPPPDLGKPKN